MNFASLKVFLFVRMCRLYSVHSGFLSGNLTEAFGKLDNAMEGYYADDDDMKYVDAKAAVSFVYENGVR